MRALLPWLGLGWLFDLAGIYLIYARGRIDPFSIALLVIGGVISAGGVLWTKRQQDTANRNRTNDD